MAAKVLIVEDNPLNMRLFCDLLKAYDFRALPCDDGHSAIAMIKRTKPDIIVMDIHLNGISGIDLTRQLKAESDICDIPVIAVTAFVMESEAYMVQEVGFQAYLSKPIKMHPFISTIREVVRGEPRSDSAQDNAMLTEEDAA